MGKGQLLPCHSDPGNLVEAAYGLTCELWLLASGKSMPLDPPCSWECAQPLPRQERPGNSLGALHSEAGDSHLTGSKEAREKAMATQSVLLP